jgi:XTP/dITP diphosphohydrolase
LLVSTRNAHKLAEIRAILGPQFPVSDLSILPGLGEVEETGATFEENATIKALAASEHFDGWVVADDSGLEVDALDGAPGVRSARYAGATADDAANNALLLRNLTRFSAAERAARFRCTMVLVRQGRKYGAFSGSVEGRLLDSPRGTGGFGYDPLFVPAGYEATFAELGSEIKNQLSHRARAAEALRAAAEKLFQKYPCHGGGHL